MSEPSTRARRMWMQFLQFYGTRFSEQFGPKATEAWCEIIDGASDEDLKAAIIACRNQYLQFPPSLPQFEALVNAAVAKRKGEEKNQVRDYWRSAIIAEVMHRYGYRTLAEFEPVLVENKHLGDPMRRLLDELENAEKAANTRSAAMWITCQRRCAEIVRAYPGLSRTA
jgi:hypothetical protein